MNLSAHEQAVDAIKPLLVGKPPEEQSAILADLLAMWVAGFRSTDQKEQKEFRDWAMLGHIKLVWQLVSLYDERQFWSEKKNDDERQQ